SRLEAERRNRANAGCGHEGSCLPIRPGKPQNPSVELTELFVDSITSGEQRSDRHRQFWTLPGEFHDASGEHIAFGSADQQASDLQKAADLVLEIALGLDEHGPARQQRANGMAIEASEANFLEPASLHNARDASSVIAVALVDLHL